MKNSKVHSGDVLLNITGASIGRCYYVDETLGESNVNQHVSILRPNNKVLTKYLYYILYSNIGQEQIRKEQTGSGREGLNFEVLKNFQVPLPEISEQESIINYIELQSNQMEFRIMKTKKLIDLLTEYRSALISDVVSGKVNVIE
jgi:type I restriction enzyme S subunit